MRNVLILAALTDLLQNDFDVTVPDDSEILSIIQAGLVKNYHVEDSELLSADLKSDIEELQAEFLVRARADIGC
ncbi:hypothetical protein NS115_03805 [Paenibacillus jamilae]|uniref:Uncharacterized protein n=1 Tax=Paenibacillus jamilae TaxID=114136 RepID=A0ACC4ZZJ2_9BACL|nr:hypothetical protein [Paenibacillus jamilae]KTS84464.1 hypothetical protein NS115_03805 [Paenibacillus jamilae]KTT55196.1 hypothetical protein SB7C_12300 [Staphylococcus epidermidis]